jgi:quercetin dioxygenase-like cupin family protein
VTRIRTLRAHRHAVYRLAPNLLLVFKPRGHREAEHAHPHRQRLRVLHGELLVRTARRAVVFTPESRAAVLSAGRRHETVALRDTWLVAMSGPPRRHARSDHRRSSSPRLV